MTRRRPQAPAGNLDWQQNSSNLLLQYWQGKWATNTKRSKSKKINLAWQHQQNPSNQATAIKLAQKMYLGGRIGKIPPTCPRCCNIDWQQQ